MLPILYPAVKEGAARLRFFLTCNHTEDQNPLYDRTISEELARIRSPA